VNVKKSRVESRRMNREMTVNATSIDGSGGKEESVINKIKKKKKKW
jgi:hypothetical protein